jgi:hypothetical protein
MVRRSQPTDAAYDVPTMSTSRRTTPENRSTATVDPLIPLQPRTGTGPTTDRRRDRPEPTRAHDPPTMIRMIDRGGLGPAPDRT